MKINLEIPIYTKETGVKCEWELGFEIVIKYEKGITKLVANKEGLVSLAKILLTLAQDEVSAGCHLHLDEYNSLDTGSSELIIEKK